MSDPTLKAPHEIVELHFPCRGATLNLERDLHGPHCEAFRTKLFSEQRAYETNQSGAGGRVSCGCVEQGKARFLVKLLKKGQVRPILYLARFPRSGPLHADDCYFREHEVSLPPDTSVAPTISRSLGGDFAAFSRELPDPELMPLPKQGGSPRSTTNQASCRRTNSDTISLRSFATKVLQASGMCEWKPVFRGARDEWTFDGRVAATLNSLAMSASGNRSTRLMRRLPDSVRALRWCDLTVEGSQPLVTKCLSFGFVHSLGSPTETGARELKLSSNPSLPLLIPPVVLAEAAKNLESPFGSHQALVNPVWVMFVAQLYHEEWKIHVLAGFRVTEIGAIPVTSNHEESMVRRLIAEHRRFRRWLISPPDMRGRKFVPDFQLLDTPGKEFIEVAGLMDNPEYALQMLEKQALLGERLLIWDTRKTIDQFLLPLRIHTSSLVSTSVINRH